MDGMELPPIAAQMIGAEGMRVEQTRVFDPQDPCVVDKIFEFFGEKCIGIFRDEYFCAEKWTLPDTPKATSFISFGVDDRQKRNPKSIAMEVNEFCCNRRKKGDGAMAVYYYSDGASRRHIIIVGIHSRCS